MTDRCDICHAPFTPGVDPWVWQDRMLCFVCWDKRDKRED